MARCRVLEDGMSLYLFESTLSIFAVSADEAGAEIPVYETETWTLIGQVAKAQLAPDVVATEKERGFCLLDADELRERLRPPVAA
jgi:hypothetical protein